MGIVLLVFWWFLWGIFHLAGNVVHLAFVAGILCLVLRVVHSSRIEGA